MVLPPLCAILIDVVVNDQSLHVAFWPNEEQTSLEMIESEILLFRLSPPGLDDGDLDRTLSVRV